MNNEDMAEKIEQTLRERGLFRRFRPSPELEANIDYFNKKVRSKPKYDNKWVLVNNRKVEKIGETRKELEDYVNNRDYDLKKLYIRKVMHGPFLLVA